MICSSINLLRFISVLLNEGLWLKLEEFQGSTSRAPPIPSRQTSIHASLSGACI